MKQGIPKPPVKRNIFFDLIILIGFLLLLEFFLGKFFLEKFFPNDFKLNNHPLIELKSGRIQFRENIFDDFDKFYFIGANKPKHFKSIKGAFSLDKKEGRVSTNFGDFILNSNGTRGPYFNLYKKKGVKRIITLGASTTLGWWVGNENTYPRLLERMLNNKLNHNDHFQVINAAMYYNDSCDVKIKFKEKILKLDPDLILIMSGWNDINKFRDTNINSLESYCMENRFFNQLYIYRLIKNILKQKYGFRSDFNSGVIDKNFEYYKDNIEFIVKLSNLNGINVGLVSLPTILNKWLSIKNSTTIPPQVKVSNNEITYHRDSGLKINQAFQKFSEKYKNVFYVNSGITFNSKGKTLFFSDLVHQTEAGNRLQAYSIYKKLNEIYQIHPIKHTTVMDINIISKNQLELEYLKSIFATSKLEDLSYSGCISFHEICNVNQHSFGESVYVTMALEFTLGSIIQFREELKDLETYNYYEKFLEKSLKIAPDFSLTYWVLGILKKMRGEEFKSREFLSRAVELNPNLKDISFENEYSDFLQRRTQSHFIEKLSDLLFLLKSSPFHISSYAFFQSLNNQDNLTMERMKRLTYSLYLSSPLLARSILVNYINYLIGKKNHLLAIKVISVFKSLHPEYFNELNNSINKNKSVSANNFQ